MTIENHLQIIEKLDKLTFIKKDGDSLISEEGFILWWDFKFTNFASTIMPVQLVIRISHNEQVISSWGCESNTDTFDFVQFIQKKQNAISNYKYDLKDEQREAGIELFNNL